jgi:hypothetical protein
MSAKRRLAGRIAVLLVIATALALPGCGRKLRGSGVAATRTVVVKPFSSIKIAGGVEVRVIVGSTESVEVIGDDNIVTEVGVRVSGGSLRIRDVNRDYKAQLPLVILVHARNLDVIKAAGSARIDVTGLKAMRFSLKTAGSSSVRIDGEVIEAKFTLAGAGRIDARELKAEIVEAKIAGAGNICVFASTLLDATIAGVGKIDCYGNPASINRDISGIGSVNLK